MASYRDVKGLSVVALAEGKKIGQIEDIVVDPEARAVRWLRIGSGVGSLFGGGSSSWLSSDAVHSIGEHAVTIESAGAVRQSQDVPEAVEMVKSGRALLGKKVLTESGRFLGETRDFTFDPASFRLISILLAQGNAVSPQTSEIDAQSLRTIGQDLVVVADNTNLTPRETHNARAEGRNWPFGGHRQEGEAGRRTAAANPPAAPAEQRQTADEDMRIGSGEPQPTYRPFGTEGPVVEPPMPDDRPARGGEPYPPDRPDIGSVGGPYPDETAVPGGAGVYDPDYPDISRESQQTGDEHDTRGI